MLHRRGSLPEALVGGVSSQGPCNRDPPIGEGPDWGRGPDCPPHLHSPNDLEHFMQADLTPQSEVIRTIVLEDSPYDPEHFLQADRLSAPGSWPGSGRAADPGHVDSDPELGEQVRQLRERAAGPHRRFGQGRRTGGGSRAGAACVCV